MEKDTILPLPLQLHQDGARLIGLPFRWDKREAKVVVKKKKIYALLVPLFFLVFFLISAHSTYHYWTTQETIKVAASCVLIVYTFLPSFVYHFLRKNDIEAAHFFNGCRTLEKYFKRNGTACIRLILGPLYALILTWLIEGFLWSTRVLPPSYAVAAFVVPCFPFNYFSAILPHCHMPPGQRVQGDTLVLMQTIMSAGISWIVNIPVYILGFTCTTHVLVGFFFQVQALEGFQRCIMSREKIGCVVPAYRQLQLLNRLFNVSHKGVLICVIIGLTLADTCFAYLIVRGPSTLPVFVKGAVFGMLAQMVWMQLVVFGYAGGIHDESRAIVNASLSLRRIALNPKMRKALRSCPPLKVVFGECNYFERNTPPKSFQFSVDRFVDLLLMEKGQQIG